MAEIDFRIPLQTRPVQTPSIVPTLLALGRLQQGQQRGRINDLLIGRGEREAAQAAQIQEALATLGQRRGAQQQPAAPAAFDVPSQDVSVPPGGAQALPELEDTLASQPPPRGATSSTYTGPAYSRPNYAGGGDFYPSGSFCRGQPRCRAGKPGDRPAVGRVP